MRLPRFRTRTLMAAILVVGGLAGLLARDYDQGRRSRQGWARLMARRQVTDDAVNLGRSDLAAAGRRPPSSQDQFSTPERPRSAPGPTRPGAGTARSARGRL